jgi:hypothetical protein
VVGTPGRVYDMLRRRNLRADSIKMFVLDEADEMLSRGFKDQIYDIFQLLPPKLQVRYSHYSCIVRNFPGFGMSHWREARLYMVSACWSTLGGHSSWMQAVQLWGTLCRLCSKHHQSGNGWVVYCLGGTATCLCCQLVLALKMLMLSTSCLLFSSTGRCVLRHPAP